MIKIEKTKQGFKISRTPCVVCGELPFGDEYCCGHIKSQPETPIERATRYMTPEPMDPKEALRFEKERNVNDGKR